MFERPANFARLFERLRTSWLAVFAVVFAIFVLSIVVGYTAVGLEEHKVLEQVRKQRNFAPEPDPPTALPMKVRSRD